MQLVVSLNIQWCTQCDTDRLHPTSVTPRDRMYPGYGPVVTSRTRARSGRIQRRKSSLQIGPSVTHVPEIRIAHHVQFVTPVCHCRIGLYILRQIDVVASLSLWVACPHNLRIIVLYLYCSFRFFMPLSVVLFFIYVALHLLRFSVSSFFYLLCLFLSWFSFKERTFSFKFCHRYFNRWIAEDETITYFFILFLNFVCFPLSSFKPVFYFYACKWLLPTF